MHRNPVQGLGSAKAFGNVLNSQQAMRSALGRRIELGLHRDATSRFRRVGTDGCADKLRSSGKAVNLISVFLIASHPKIANLQK
jgi:hypothetical protein